MIGQVEVRFQEQRKFHERKVQKLPEDCSNAAEQY